MIYKRRLPICVISIVLALITTLVGCKSSNLNEYLDDPPTPPVKQDEFAVYYLDVGQGDCIFIDFPDGKNMLIDTGENNDVNQNYLQEFFAEKEISKIDYFLLTHSDSDHIGNALYFLDNFDIGKMFLPYFNSALIKLFPDFKLVLEKANQKEIDYSFSDFSHSIVGENYALAFLSPSPKDMPSGEYSDLNSSLSPTDGQINNVSPIIYFECFGIRFVFTGDAQSSSERVVVDRYKNKLYDVFHKDKVSVNLESVDYLKLGHHGSKDASCEEFLRLLQPKNVIISVGAKNYYGHPSTEVFIRLDQLDFEYGLYRTDTNGTICIKYLDGERKTQVEVQ